MEHTDVTKDAEKTLGNNEQTTKFEIVAETTEPRTFYYSVVEKVNGDVKRTKMYRAAEEGGQTLYFVRCTQCRENVARDSPGYETLERAQSWLDTVLTTPMFEIHGVCGPFPVERIARRA